VHTISWPFVGVYGKLMECSGQGDTAHDELPVAAK
jgi:hypothetical protein